MKKLDLAGALIAVAVICVCSMGACGGDDDDGDPLPDADVAAIDAASIDASGTDAADVCGPADLCSRTINECGIALTQQQCEGWYADPAQHMCADIEGYTTCNCGCVEEDTCELYFSCGTTCFEDFC